MSSKEKIEKLKEEYYKKIDELDKYVLNKDNDYLSEEAEKMRKEIYELKDKISLLEKALETKKSRANIEEDIKILNELKGNKALFSGGWGDILTDEEKEAIDNIIEDRKRLETEKADTIKKLEKRENQNNKRYGQAIDNDEFPEMYEYKGQVREDRYILSIMKGEKNE